MQPGVGPVAQPPNLGGTDEHLDMRAGFVQQGRRLERALPATDHGDPPAGEHGQVGVIRRVRRELGRDARERSRPFANAAIPVATTTRSACAVGAVPGGQPETVVVRSRRSILLGSMSGTACSANQRPYETNRSTGIGRGISSELA